MAGSVYTPVIGMSRFMRLRARQHRPCPVSRSAALAPVAWVVVVVGCGPVPCPEPFVPAPDGVCVEVDRTTDGPGPEERCDGLDNNFNGAVDEHWPELGDPCGLSRGECVEGRYTCSQDGLGAICAGGVRPVDEVCDQKDNDCNGIVDDGFVEVCDGQDNDCDGIVDEGVLSVKDQFMGDHATVSAVDGGFALVRDTAQYLRVNTYDLDGWWTELRDQLYNPPNDNAFLESDAWDNRVVVAFGKHEFHVLEVHVDSDLVPTIVGTQQLHSEWNQGIDSGIYEPPHNPRVSASPPRFVGHRDIQSFALSPFSGEHLDALASPPAVVADMPSAAYFDAAGGFAAWEQGGNVRIAWLLDTGELSLAIDVGRGGKPALALGPEGPCVAYLEDGKLMLSELSGATLQCLAGGFCNAVVEATPIEESATTATGLAFDETRDAWVVAAGDQLLMVSRGEHGPVVGQRITSRVRDALPTRIDVAVSGGTAAIVQTAENRESVLTFMGCF